MALRNSDVYWGSVSQWLHWLTALLIFVTVALGFIADSMDSSPAKIRLFLFHKSLGIGILVLVIFRLLWKLFTPQPLPASKISPQNEKLAQLGQWVLYALLVALPLSGWIINSAANFPFQWLNLFEVPDLPGIPKSWQNPAIELHWWLFLLLACAVLGHVLMTMIHHYYHHSDLLLRILPGRQPVVFFTGFVFTFTLLMGGLLSGTQQQSPPKYSQDDDIAEYVSTAKLKIPDQHTKQLWELVPDKSTLVFIGEYEGTPFDGAFKEFQSALYFDRDSPETGFFDVVINTASVTAYSDDFDSALLGKEWFFVSQYPQATYKSTRITEIETGFIAEGILTIKNVQRPVTVNFSWIDQGQGLAKFVGQSVIDRTEFAVGVGEWTNDPTIGFKVSVNISLQLKLPSLNENRGIW